MNSGQRYEFLSFALTFLLVLLAATMLIAAWTGVRPLQQIHFRVIDILWGIGAAALMVVVFGMVVPVRNQAEQILGPSLAACRWYDLAMLACLVGLIEELMFRGVLEPWLARWHPLMALIVVNTVFGLLHAVSLSYAVVAGVLGGLLSLLARWPGEPNLLRPIVTHAVYDFIGFVWIGILYRRRSGEAPA